MKEEFAVHEYFKNISFGIRGNLLLPMECDLQRILPVRTCLNRADLGKLE